MLLCYVATYKVNKMEATMDPAAIATTTYIDVITKLEIDKLLERVTSKNYFFSYDQNVIDLISEVGFDETFGARPIKRAIQDKIEDLISEKILTDEIVENQEYVLVVEGEKENRKISVLTKEIPKTTKKRTSKIK